MPIPFYRCEKCRREFDSVQAATRCENAHLIPKTVEAKRYTVQAFPYSVEVTFANGEKRIYNSEDLGG